MNRTEITNLLREYERTHSVDEYVIDGIHVWPLLKIAIAYSSYIDDLIEEQAEYIPPRIKNTVVAFKNIIQRLTSHAQRLPLPVDEQDVVCLTTPADRRLWMPDKGWYDVYFDPLFDLFPDRKLFSLEIVHGISPQLPRYRPSYVVDSAMTLCSLKAKLATIFIPRELPGWCDELIYFINSSDLHNIDVKWIKKKFYEFRYFSALFEKLFQKNDFCTLLMVCWYSPISMAACHAAKKLGLKTVDLQHGMQSEEHFGYSGWVKKPAQGYTMMPDYFWTWGDNDKKRLVENNEGTITDKMILTGGCPLLNLWQSDKSFLMDDRKKAEKLVSGYEKVISVTLQHLSPDDLTQIKEIIEKGSNSWLWLVRSRKQDTKTLKKIEQFFSVYDNVNVREASLLPLYALFEVSDVHITWFSSCAVEALAFGIKSILLHENGRIAFEEYIEKGLMFYTVKVNEIIEIIKKSEKNIEDTTGKALFSDINRAKEALSSGLIFD